MDKAGLLLLSSPGRVTIGLLFWDGPGHGLRLLLRDTDHFSSRVNGTLGKLCMAPGSASSEATSAFQQAAPRVSVCLPASPSLSFTDSASVSQANFTRMCSGGPQKQMTANEH